VQLVGTDILVEIVAQPDDGGDTSLQKVSHNKSHSA
jgi:hypothetical protein